MARLSLSLGLKAITDSNAYTVVSAFQFLITARLVRPNEGSRVRMINLPKMRTSQAEDDTLLLNVSDIVFFLIHAGSIVLLQSRATYFLQTDWLLR